MSLYDINHCWDLYDQIKNTSEDDQVVPNLTESFQCKNCNHIENDRDDVCTNCGLMIYDNIIYENHNNYDSTNDMTVLNYAKKNFNKNDHIYKMKVWFENTSQEKNEYKLNLYTKKICETLQIDSHIDYICDLVNVVLKCIKKNDGTKRSRVKDGIIVVCIFYTHKKYHLQNYTFTLQNIAKKLNLNIKYVSKAEMLILELINKNKISMDKNILLNVNTSLNILPDIKLQFTIFNNHYLNFDKNDIDLLFKKLEELLKKYDKNNLLINHAPFSISIGCLYYILKQNHDIPIILLSKIYDISHITILKIYNIISVLDKTN